jgi:DNA-binding CsgD family transcriptional regulator
MNAPRVLIVSADTLSGLGLRTLLFEHFGISAAFLSAFDDDMMETALHADYALVFCDRGALPTVRARASRVLSRRLVLFTATPAPAARDAGDDDDDELRTLYTAATLDALLAALDPIVSGVRKDRMEGASALTPREIEVLKLLASGCIIKEIADRLGISTHTAITHRKNISAKLGIKSVSGLTVFATIHGYVVTDRMR